MSALEGPARTRRTGREAGWYVRAQETKSESHDAKDRTQVAVVALHISTVLSLLIASMIMVLLWFRAEENPPEGLQGVTVLVALAVACIGHTVLSAIVSVGLQRRSRWAWTAAVILFALYLPSAYLPLGLIGLVGALSPGTRAEFHKRFYGRGSPRRRQHPRRRPDCPPASSGVSAAHDAARVDPQTGEHGKTEVT